MWNRNLRLLQYLLASGLCAGLATNSFAKDYSKTVIAEQPTRVQYYYSWGPGCSFKTVKIDVSVAPTHGTLTPRAVTETIKNNRSGPVGECAGKEIQALEISYASKSGFHGTDAFTINVHFGNGRNDIDHFYITVP